MTTTTLSKRMKWFEGEDDWWFEESTINNYWGIVGNDNSSISNDTKNSIVLNMS